ncbi:phage antirepressor N-terminal domain-containing protein [Hafnia psychrotolerans]|uniref:Antirepressor n=1 Tax=Hafnia psychrotolerans TaxID=1477018 RepID=A0ABQ1G245_9GAMM|nr:phage antirepressor N-terminal domain-containing protein [Hafnia psychrotolerans]GGA34056.1 antirepressor [Hafnia psychrotolerans]
MTSIAILEAVNTSAVQFHGQPIITAMVAGVVYVAMKPIVENMGMSWTTQHRKLMQDMNKSNHPHKSMVENERDGHMTIPSKFNCRDISMVAADGKLRQLLCIPLRKLNGWLFSINPERVRADIKDKLIQYQEECFSVLHEYWTKGEVKKKVRQSTATQLTPLRQTAERLITTGLGRLYPDIWKLVHQRFDIEHIHQLQPEQISEAVEYLNVLEGEFIGKNAEVVRAKYQLTDEELCSLCWMWKNCVRMIGHIADVEPILRAAEHRLAGAYWSMAHEYPRNTNVARRALEKATSHIEQNEVIQDNWRVLKNLRIDRKYFD